MNFEWDEQKNELNIDKHGFDFADVYRVFSLPMAVDLDERNDYGEDRWIGTGLLDEGGVMSSTSRTDWSRIDAMTDDDIDTSDIPPLTDEFFSKAKLRMPPSSLATVAVRVDSETLTWFQSKGEEAEQHMAAALRIYAEAQKTAATMRQSA